MLLVTGDNTPELTLDRTARLLGEAFEEPE